MPTDLGAEFREAKAAVGHHRRLQAKAELELAAYLKSRRGVPVHMLYHAATGEPRDRHLARLVAAVEAKSVDVEWCRGLVVACGEAAKGCTLAEARKPSRIDQILATIDEGLAD